MTELPFQRIARELAAAIESGQIVKLDSLRTLAASHRVAYATMWKAVRELRRKGIAFAPPGRRTMILRPKAQDPITPDTSTVGNLFAAMKADIADGVYQVGKDLPKNEFFVRTYRVSHSTVSMALRRLAHENLAHKNGRRWVVGPAPEPTQTIHAAQRRVGVPVVLIQDHLPETWNEFSLNQFTGKFMSPFTSEIVTADHIMMPVARARRQGASLLAVPAGREETESIIDGLGDRYRGALVMCSTPREERLEEWIALLGRTGRPVAFFDANERGGYLTRSELGLGGRFFRMSLDEDAALRLVLGALHVCGHRRVGMHGWEFHDWGRRRAGRLAELCSEFRGMAFVRSAPAEALWNFANLDGMNEALINAATIAGVQLFDADGDLPAVIGEYLRRHTPSLTSLILDHGITALIAPNDHFAREYHFWCRAAGIEVPRDLSIVSFDNTPMSVYFPISTVEFGHARLGYLAAHALTGRIPVRTDRSGAIRAVPTLVDRGSIDRPGNPRRALG